ncbi:MAG: hypothetical protein OXB86_00125 [Bdellovibrionales bacterium]|nr:hypothetical protein [Bdellovibrionales bacterium]
MVLKSCLLAAILAISSPIAEAILFQNDYVSFELPENWKCKPFKTDWVCHSIHSSKRKEAMIILTAKETGGLDNLTEYEGFLNKPRTIKAKTGQSFPAKIISPGKKVFLNSHPWVDGWFLGSEVPSYYTRYEVTVCCGTTPKLAILVTLSARKDRYSKYSQAFMKAIKSLKISPDINKALSKMRAMGTHESMGNIAAYMGDLIDGELDAEEDYEEGLFSGMDATTMGALGAAGLGAATYLISRLRKKRRRREKASRRRKKRRSSSKK